MQTGPFRMVSAFQFGKQFFPLICFEFPGRWEAVNYMSLADEIIVQLSFNVIEIH